jgi:nucleoside-diphosphate-sugar epimerase
MAGELVLVTGGSGFLGGHCILQLLAEGYRVRTTVRSPSREAEVRTMLKSNGVEFEERLSFVVADLASDSGWADAAVGAWFVLHVAAPFTLSKPQYEDDLIVPAREGTLRVLRAARDAGVKRVVLTSSTEAIVRGHKPTETPFSEETWSNVETSGINAYGKSKALAERAAWHFMAREGKIMELSVINPVAMYGPVLGPDFSPSVEAISQMLTGNLPRLPHLAFDAVDVRDVARLHLLAMTQPAAKGERFIATSGFTSLEKIAHTLKMRLGTAAKLVSTKTVPDWMLRLASPFVPELAEVVPLLGKPWRTTNAKAQHLLNWKPRSVEEAVIATAESLVRLQLLKSQAREVAV